MKQTGQKMYESNSDKQLESYISAKGIVKSDPRSENIVSVNSTVVITFHTAKGKKDFGQFCK